MCWICASIVQNVLSFFVTFHFAVLYVSFADIDECASNPCESGCTCVDEVNGYICGTAAGYTGLHCETGRQWIAKVI
jgi:hypothetical protein